MKRQLFLLVLLLYFGLAEAQIIPKGLYCENICGYYELLISDSTFNETFITHEEEIIGNGKYIYSPKDSTLILNYEQYQDKKPAVNNSNIIRYSFIIDKSKENNNDSTIIYIKLLDSQDSIPFPGVIVRDNKDNYLAMSNIEGFCKLSFSSISFIDSIRFELLGVSNYLHLNSFMGKTTNVNIFLSFPSLEIPRYYREDGKTILFIGRIENNRIEFKRSKDMVNYRILNKVNKRPNRINVGF